MIQYLNEHGAAGVFQKLETREEIFYVREYTAVDAEKGRKGSYYDSKTRSIVIDVEHGVQDEEMNVISPAVGAVHEGGHALEDAKRPERRRNEKGKYDPKFGTKHERRVVQQYEHPAAEKTGEPKRVSHSGQKVPVSSPTSNEPTTTIDFGNSPPPSTGGPQ